VRQTILAVSLSASWLVLGLGCQQPASEGGAGGKAPAAAGSGQVIATVSGEPITLDQLDLWIKDDLYQKTVGSKNPSALYEFRADALDRMIDERLLEAEAQKRGVDTNALLMQENPQTAPTDEEVQAFFDENKARLGDATLEQIAPQIRRYLMQQAAQQAHDQFIDKLREQAGVALNFEPPRIEVAATGPSIGPENAPVTIVEFSDFQCPFCARARPVVQQIHERYPDKVRVVYRHLPLESIHPRARAAAEASVCADEQGHFWEYHDLLFDNNRALGDEDLQHYAEQAGLDVEAFKTCVGDKQTDEIVDRDLAAAHEAGLSGTPAFFVNGILLTGAQPIDRFVEVIDRELARTPPTS
jgi:protein-disulfide isomerase